MNSIRQKQALRYRVCEIDLRAADALETDWQGLERRADCSFFQSWGWIGTWLEQIAMDLPVTAVRVEWGGQLVGLGIIVSGAIRRRVLIRSRAVFLNEHPYGGDNMVIEFNGLLCARGHEQAVYTEVVAYLARRKPSIDEIHFGALAPDASRFFSRVRRAGFEHQLEESSGSWSIDLVDIPSGPAGVLSGLSRNRRAQISCSIRLLETRGAIRIEQAQDVGQALQFLDRLKVLHTAHWRSRGKDGAFAKVRWEAFHRALIGRCFDQGAIQLLKIRAGEYEVGYLYNVIWRGHVYVLQSGFCRPTDKRLMPGYSAHVLAAAYNKALGMEVYDLMHGDESYKKRLCDRREELVWAVLQRRRPKFLVERLALKLVRKIRAVAETRTGSEREAG